MEDKVNDVFDDFKPVWEWQKDKGCETLVVHLPDFVKDHIRVEVQSRQTLIICGERHLHEGKWICFREELAIPAQSNANEIEAEYINDRLYVKMPRKINPIAKHRSNSSLRHIWTTLEMSTKSVPKVATAVSLVVCFVAVLCWLPSH